MTAADSATYGTRPAGPPQRDADPRKLAVLAVGALAAVALALAAALDVRLGVAALVALAVLPALRKDVAFGVAAIAALAFLARLPAVGVAPTALLVLVAGRWWTVRRRRASVGAETVAAHPTLAAVVVGLVLWCGLSLTWAQRSGPGQAALLDWIVAAALFGIVSTSLVKTRQLRVVLYGFVGGAVASVLIGLAARHGLAGSSLAAQTAFEGRLQGGAGDPNFLAAGLVAAGALAWGLFMASSRPGERRALAGAFAVLLVGLGATESRGGVIAAAVTALAAVALARGARVRAALGVGAGAGLVVAALALSPGGLQRVTASDPQGDGRADLWTVATRMVDQRPLLGVGLANYRVRSGEFVREPGSLQFVDLIAGRPHEVHNTYLQFAAETGLPGALAFLLVASLALRSAWLAQRRFAALGDHELAAIARAVLCATVAMLTALVFITDGQDLRLWVLFGLGPALLGMASRRARTG